MPQSKPPRFIASARNPRWPAQEAELRALFGVTGPKWPRQGCPPRCIQGIWVHVLPADHESLRDPGRHPLTGRRRRASQHRCIASCPDCGATVSAGRLAQHRCDARVTKDEAKRRAEFRDTNHRQNAKADLRTLAIAYHDAPPDTQDEDDAFNAFCEAATRLMSVEQKNTWDSWCFKATQDEIVSEALRILGMQLQPRATGQDARGGYDSCDPEHV